MSILYEGFLRMRNVIGKIYRENKTSQFIFNNPFLESRAVFEIIWTNIVEQDRAQMIIRLMRFACWITKNIDKQTQNMLSLFLFQGKKVYANAPLCPFIPALPVLFNFILCSHTANRWALNGNIKDSLLTAGPWHKAS